MVESIRMRFSWVVLSACTASSPVEPTPDAPVEQPWATYRIAPGDHTATVDRLELGSPIDGVTDVVGRDYELALDASASYLLTAPTQPEDQYDWNKLPGLSDCGGVDLAEDGAMFGWRWRVDVEPNVLEITAYANNASVHLTFGNDLPLVTLDADDLAAEAPLRYRIAREQTRYVFQISGEVRARGVAATATLPRRCSEMPVAPLAWAGAFYFGGTSVAPQQITAKIRERSYEN